MSATGADTIKRLAVLCAKVGFDLKSLSPSILGRLELLAEHTATVADSERMASMASAVFRHHEATRPDEAFSDAERRIVVLGCLFSDIGKTGPVNADLGGQRLIAQMFAVEGVRDDTQSVARFLKGHFPEDASDRIRRFTELGLDPEITIRQFWNLHSTWTLQITEASRVPAETIAAAATHHLLDEVNPDAIVASDHTFTRSFGDNASFDRAEKLIILLDKYDAVRRRGRQTHAHAIAWLRARVESNPRFHGDREFLSLIEDLDAVNGRFDDSSA